ncbi:NAD kinase [Hoyosella rhizosphaerae]|uniref:NAD kinase n=1 Tax=Hoyosella rhizosphaerae TaxID=1755582 RepID=A0A916XBK4_9ACTN|nr:NAD kinase [Hoyosella rhizosphaerae]MBN4926184.1 NAD kinase [Hoyosella rhizosphaerae]GGC61446.1 NAD kinase [Hoyosella rhizosphaerae]
MTSGATSAAAREILLVAHTGRPDIAPTIKHVSHILQHYGMGLRVLAHEAASTHLVEETLSGYETVIEAGPDAAAGCEIVLVLGGDGSMLRAAELARQANIPVLGINLGRIGFLAETEVDHLEDALGKVVRREYRVETRMTLDMKVWLGGEIIASGWALNEASVEKAPRLGVLEVVLEVDGRPVSAFGCDGVLIATPTGSTAYAFSAGGPIVWPELEALLVVPSNAHALFARPMVTSPNSVVAVEIDPSGHDALVFCDGRRISQVPAGGRIEFRKDSAPVLWARLDSAPFADRLVRKFELPVQGWRGRSVAGLGEE